MKRTKGICSAASLLAKLKTQSLRSGAALLAVALYAVGLSSAAATVWNQTQESPIEQAGAGGVPIPNSTGKPCTTSTRIETSRMLSNPNGGTVPRTGLKSKVERP